MGGWPLPWRWGKEIGHLGGALSSWKLNKAVILSLILSAESCIWVHSLFATKLFNDMGHINIKWLPIVRVPDG